MRFPTYPPDILARADALLASKYGTSEPIDPVLVEVACEAMMVERARCAAIWPDPDIARPVDSYGDGYCVGFGDAAARFKGAIERGEPPIAKAIRGTAEKWQRN